MSNQPAPFIPTIVGETRSKAVARRLRGQLAERNINVSELARRMGVPQQKMQRRYAGITPIQLDELDTIQKVTGIDAEYLLTGVNAKTPPPRGGAYPSLHTESNRGPFHYKGNSSPTVVELHPTGIARPLAS